MSRFLIAILVSLPLLPGSAQEPEKTVRSAEMKAARKAYEEEKAKAIEAVNVRYAQKLRSLKGAASGRNYEVVKAIDAEIASLDFTKTLVETKWLWLRNPDAKPDKLRFTADGEMQQEYFKATWTVIAPWTVAIRLDGRIGYLVFDPAMQGFTGRDFDGSDKLIGRRDK